jgi:hypothetical protein
MQMSKEELRQAAREVLAKAFKGEDVSAHVVHAATTIVLSKDPEPSDQ